MSPGGSNIRVGDCMHAGILSCPPDASFSELARAMGDHRVHAVAVADIAHGRPWGTWHIVSDMDLMAAVAEGREPTARQTAGPDSITVSSGETIEQAAALMRKEGVSHLVVLHESGGYPVGIVSTLDIAGAYGGAAERPET